MLSCLRGIRLFVTPWTVVHQAPLFMKSSRQEYWSGLPFPSPGELPDPGIEPGSPELASGFITTELPGKSIKYFYFLLKISVSWRPPWHLPGLNHPPGVELRTWSLPDRWRVRSPRLHRNSGREWKVKATFCPEGLGHLRFFAQILFHRHKPLAGH